MPALKNKFPNLKIWLIEEQTHRLMEQLGDGSLDGAIMANPIEGQFASHILFEEAFYFACAATHPFAHLSRVSISDLANQQIMLLDEGHCLRDQAMAVCQIAKANEIADFTATSLETLRLMVQAGIGVTLLPALAAQVYASDLLRCIPFNKPVPSRTLALFWRASSPKKKCFVAIAKEIIKIKLY